MRPLAAFFFLISNLLAQAGTMAATKAPSPHLPPGTKTAVTLKTAPRPAARWVQVRATSYSWREPDHRRVYGRKNCMGGQLTELVEGCRQCAADTDVFPLGTILEVPGTGRRIVTDRGSAVEGRHHIDLHFNTLREMLAWGTQMVRIRIVRLGWGTDGR